MSSKAIAASRLKILTLPEAIAVCIVSYLWDRIALTFYTQIVMEALAAITALLGM